MNDEFCLETEKLYNFDTFFFRNMEPFSKEWFENHLGSGEWSRLIPKISLSENDILTYNLKVEERHMKRPVPPSKKFQRGVLYLKDGHVQSLRFTDPADTTLCDIIARSKTKPSMHKPFYSVYIGFRRSGEICGAYCQCEAG